VPQGSLARAEAASVSAVVRVDGGCTASSHAVAVRGSPFRGHAAWPTVLATPRYVPTQIAPAPM
jgi:hypothetical protein